MPVNNEGRGEIQDVGDSGPLAPSDTPPSDEAYADIYGWVQDLLEETETTLPGSTLKRYVDSTLRFLRITWACLPAYADLEGDDLSAMDEAVGHMVAARYRSKHPKKGTGEVLELKQGPIDYKYAARAGNSQSLEEEWLEQAYTVLQEIACIAAVLETIRAIPLFQTAGKRSSQQARGVYTRSLNPLYTVLADEWDAERLEWGGAEWGGLYLY